MNVKSALRIVNRAKIESVNVREEEEKANTAKLSNKTQTEHKHC